MASFTERDLGTMVTLGLMEMAYRRRKSVQELASSLAGIPELWETSIDAQSGAQTLRQTIAGRVWQLATGRSVSVSSVCSSRSRASSGSSSG